MASEKVSLRANRELKIIVSRTESRKTMFFLHGLGGRAEQWHTAIEYFKQDYNIVAPNFFGQGGSPKPEKNANSIYSFKALQQDIQTLFNRYATEENYIIGHSYGGAFATQLTLDNQTRINGLILVTPVPLAPYSAIPYFLFIPPFVLEIMRPLIERQFKKLAFDSHTNKKIIRTELRSPNPMYVLKALTLGMKSIPRRDISNLKTPTLVITVKNDGLVPRSDVEAYYNQLPNVEFIDIANAGHMVIVEQPQALNREIECFVNEVTQPI